MCEKPDNSGQAGARKIRAVEVSPGMIEAGLLALDQLGITISAQEGPEMVASLWSSVEARRRHEISGKVRVHRQRG